MVYLSYPLKKVVMTKHFAFNDLGYWMLPKPKKLRHWERIPRLVKFVPFGYEIDPNDERWLNPIEKELELLELAKKHLKQYSYREVAVWLTKQTGKYISHSGLKKRVDIEQRRKTAVAIKRKLAKRLEEILQEIEKLENQGVGAYRIREPE